MAEPAMVLRLDHTTRDVDLSTCLQSLFYHVAENGPSWIPKQPEIGPPLTMKQRIEARTRFCVHFRRVFREPGPGGIVFIEIASTILSKQVWYYEITADELTAIFDLCHSDAATRAKWLGGDPRGETPNLSVLSRENAPEGAQIDYQALANSLRLERRAIPARLVEFMADKTSADAGDIARHVHGDEHASDDAMRQNANRTTAYLREMGSLLYFKFKGGKMHRGVPPE